MLPLQSLPGTLSRAPRNGAFYMICTASQTPSSTKFEVQVQVFECVGGHVTINARGVHRVPILTSLRAAGLLNCEKCSLLDDIWNMAVQNPLWLVLETIPRAARSCAAHSTVRLAFPRPV